MFLSVWAARPRARGARRAASGMGSPLRAAIGLLLLLLLASAVAPACAWHSDASPLAELEYPPQAEWPRLLEEEGNGITVVDVPVNTSLVPDGYRLGGSRWAMRAMLPSAASAGRALRTRLPVALMLHPTQVFQMSPRNDQYYTALYLAKQGMITVFSLERKAQFGGIGNAAGVSDGLARRGVAMVRTLYELAEKDFTSPLYGRARRAFCAYGYSLGALSVQALASYVAPEDGLRCIVPVHSYPISRVLPSEFADRVNVPILAALGESDFQGTSTDMWREYARAGRTAIAIVEIGGPGVNSQHIDTSCGNQCPRQLVCCNGNSQYQKHMSWITAFMLLYLAGREDFAPIFWDVSDTALLASPGVSSVRRASKIDMSAIPPPPPPDSATKQPGGTPTRASPFRRFGLRFEVTDASAAASPVTVRIDAPAFGDDGTLVLDVANVRNARATAFVHALGVDGAAAGNDARCGFLSMRGVNRVIEGGATEALQLQVSDAGGAPGAFTCTFNVTAVNVSERRGTIAARPVTAEVNFAL